MKKVISTAIILSLAVIQTAPCFSMEETKASTATPKQFKSMVKKDKKKANDDYKYEYVNLPWWDVFGDDILKGYIEKAIVNNYDLKMATLNVEEFYQQTRIQFANELPGAYAGGGPGWFKAPGSSSTDINFGLPFLVNYEADIFLKNHDKTKSSKKLYENSKFDERAAYISIAGAVGSTYLNIVNMDKAIEIQTEIVELRKKIF